MSDLWITKILKRTRIRLTCGYTAVFTVLFLIVVGVANLLFWSALIECKKDDIVSLIRDEAHEYVEFSDFPVSEADVRNGSNLAYARDIEGNALFDLLGRTPTGIVLLHSQNLWPVVNDAPELVDVQVEGKNHHYLICRTQMVEKGDSFGYLYLFQNMDYYYHAAWHNFGELLWATLIAVLLAGVLGYYLAGLNLRPLLAAYERQSRFTADASHEMRTPLTVMSLALESLSGDEESRLGHFGQEACAMIRQELQRLTGLTEELMALAHEDENKALSADQVFSDVDFSVLLQQAVDELRLVAAQKLITITADISQGLHLDGDEAALKRLAVILLDNAVKYSPEQSHIQVIAGLEHKQIFLKVADEGEGVPDEHKARIFERFYRVDKARSRAQGGNGLGLSLAWSIVRRHHGIIKVLDNTPKGSIFAVYLPC